MRRLELFLQLPVGVKCIRSGKVFSSVSLSYQNTTTAQAPTINTKNFFITAMLPDH